MPCVLTCSLGKPEGAGELLAGLGELPASYSIRLVFAFVNRQNRSWRGFVHPPVFSGGMDEARGADWESDVYRRAELLVLPSGAWLDAWAGWWWECWQFHR